MIVAYDILKAELEKRVLIYRDRALKSVYREGYTFNTGGEAACEELLDWLEARSQS